MKKVITGLEGCSKSSGIFQELLDKATVEKPLLFGVKNYTLMKEQKDNWVKRFGVKDREFAICGFSKDYEPALDAYTSKKNPSVIPKWARFVFTSQAIIQRNRHLEFVNASTGLPVQYHTIIIDEFDFTVGIIPSLDYFFNKNIPARGDVETTLLNWVKKNYTFTDFSVLNYKLNTHNKGFTTAHWIESCPCDLIFLTSEVLSTKVLEAIGCKVETKPNPDFSNCEIRVWHNEAITANFLRAMNENVAWNHLSYDLIISDQVLNYFKEKEKALMVEVVNHALVKGSNVYRDKGILTVLTYIPDFKLQEIQDALTYYGYPLSLEEVKTLFYRDRMCQAVGRTLGFRGGKTTDLITHSSIYNSIKNENTIPYSFVEHPLLESLENLSLILERAIELRSDKRKRKINKAVIDASVLDLYFELKPSSFLTVKEIKEYCESKRIINNLGNKIPATKIAKYFNLCVTVVRLNGVNTKVIKGLNFKL